jgi:hypothetical protein
VGNPERKRLLGIHRRRWEGDIILDLTERKDWETVFWIHLAQNRDQWQVVMKLQFP